MSARHLFLASAAALLATAIVPAQNVLTLHGELGDGRSTGCYYCPNVPFTIKYSETPVRSSVYNLALYENVQLELTGIWDTTTTPHGLNVTQLSVVNGSFNLTGNGRIGTNLRFDINGAPNDVAVTFLAAANGFIPVLNTTALLLDLNSLLILGSNVLDSQGGWRFDVPIPNDTHLVGLRVFSQSLIVSVTNPLFSTNPRAQTIQS